MTLTLLALLAAGPWGFSGGLEPLRDVGADARWAQCEECHAAAARGHAGSQHAQAWTHPIFQQGYRLEPSPLCRNCHDPLGERQGVTCAVCHVRGAQVLATRPAPDAPHPTRVEPGLRTTLCAGCHEFPFAEPRDGGFALLEAPMQTTFSEWSTLDAGVTCTACHMKQGHAFPGGHDVELLRRTLRLSRVGETLEVTAVGVGHHMPTGDVFRRLVVELAPAPGAPFVTLASFTRRFDGTRVVSDTTLRPGAPARVVLKSPPPDAVIRVRYFFAPRSHLLEGSVEQRALISTVFELPLAHVAAGDR